MIMRDVKEMFEEMSEWVSDCCLMQTQKFFIYILARTHQQNSTFFSLKTQIPEFSARNAIME
jgi:hypothetical protein